MKYIEEQKGDTYDLNIQRKTQHIQRKTHSSSPASAINVIISGCFIRALP